MRLSIVIPTLGRDTMHRAIASALAVADDVVLQYSDGRPAGTTRNAAMHRVTGDWVGFCDDDDVLLGNYREVVEEHAAAGADMVVMTMRAYGELIPRPHSNGWLTYGNVGISYAVRTDLWRANPMIPGWPETARCEDWEFVQRMLDQNRNVVVSPVVTYVARPHEEEQ